MHTQSDCASSTTATASVAAASSAAVAAAARRAGQWALRGLRDALRLAAPDPLAAAAPGGDGRGGEGGGGGDVSVDEVCARVAAAAAQVRMALETATCAPRACTPRAYTRICARIREMQRRMHTRIRAVYTRVRACAWLRT